LRACVHDFCFWLEKLETDITDDGLSAFMDFKAARHVK